VLFGGEAADADGVRRLLADGGPRRLLHMYGPTETTAWCSWEEIGEVAPDARTVTVGRATRFQRIYLLDPELRPVPLGAPGEAYVGGAGVVRGYLARPALTAERFLPDPFAGEPGARMYRTGDRLRWREVRECEDAGAARDCKRTHALTHSRTSVLHFIGRVDEQVKIRGFRIEPGEIEAVLTAHAEVREARVVVRDDEPGGTRLVAYVVGAADADALRAHLRRSLPEHMVPAAFVALDRIPLTPNGKLDRKALPAPQEGPAGARDGVPRTPVEEVLAGVWAEVLRLDAVGVDDDFFARGGHSLLAMRVLSRVREVFGVELPVRAIFEHPTVAGAARRVEELRRAGLPVLPPVVPVDRAAPPPLSFAQERLWFVDQLEAAGALYNIPVARRLRGALDVDALERALGEVVRRHEALRTTFREADGALAQVIAPFAGFALPRDDLSALGQAEREAEAARRAAEDAARPFDLAAGPLFRARLLRLGGEEHVSSPLHAPRDQRRVEPGRALPRAGRAVRRLPRGAGVAAPRAPGAVRRLRRVAPRAPGRRRAGAAAGVLAGTAGRGAGAAGAPHRPPAPRRPHAPGRARADRALRRPGRAAAGAGARRGSHAVHGAARRLPGAAVEVRGDGRRGGGHPHRGAHRAASWRS
jgi:acyl carrier protein